MSKRDYLDYRATLEQYQQAVQALLVAVNAELVRPRSSRCHHATLLHNIAPSSVELGTG
jgi:hypothetical protein